MPKLSIIIPIYNVEKYIGACLESIFSQDVSLEDFEVIVVNDGTPDTSMSIVDKYKSYSNLIIINQENKGLSGARNRGLKESKGEYIWFVDSDDTISNNSISLLLELINKENANVYSFCHRKVYEIDGSFGPEIELNINGFLSMYEFSNTPLCTSCAPFYMMKRSFFMENNLYFHEGVYHEDMEFIAKLKVLCNKIYVSSATLYYYLIRENGSIMTSFNIKKSYDCLKIADELERFKREKIKSIKQKMGLNKSIAFLIILSILSIKEQYLRNSFEASQFIENFKTNITIKKHWRLFFHYTPSFYVLVSIICIFISPKLFLNLYPQK